MQRDIKLSIIIPVYNLEEYIGRTLESVLTQSYENIEVIVVDDGSKDNSWERITGMAERDSRIVAIHQDNTGVNGARLTGLAKATGEWIGFIDGDDLLDSSMYEILMTNAMKYSAEISHCGFKMVFADGRESLLHGTNVLRIQDKEDGVRDLLSGTVVEPSLCNKIYHRSLFERIRDVKMPENIRINEDLLWNYYLFSVSDRSVFEDRCLYHYMVREQSASRQRMNRHKIYDPIRVRRIILEDTMSPWKEDAQRSYLTTCIYTYCSLLDAEYKEDRKKVLKLIRSRKDWIGLMDKRPRVLARLLLFCPALFRPVYLVYQRWFARSVYC